MCVGNVEQDNRNAFDVWLCTAAGFIGVYHLLCGFKMEEGEMCLIKRIPLKSQMECWISFVSNVCDNRGKRRAASVFRKLDAFDRQRRGQRRKARKMKLSSSRHKNVTYPRAVVT